MQIPVRCSTVRKSNYWLKRIAIVESIASILISVIYLWVTPEYTGSILDLIACLVIAITIIFTIVVAIIGYIEGWYVDWYPKFECIRDE